MAYQPSDDKGQYGPAGEQTDLQTQYMNNPGQADSYDSYGYGTEEPYGRRSLASHHHSRRSYDTSSDSGDTGQNGGYTGNINSHSDRNYSGIPNPVSSQSRGYNDYRGSSNEVSSQSRGYNDYRGSSNEVSSQSRGYDEYRGGSSQGSRYDDYSDRSYHRHSSSGSHYDDYGDHTHHHHSSSGSRYDDYGERPYHHHSSSGSRYDDYGERTHHHHSSSGSRYDDYGERSHHHRSSSSRYNDSSNTRSGKPGRLASHHRPRHHHHHHSSSQVPDTNYVSTMEHMPINLDFGEQGTTAAGSQSQYDWQTMPQGMSTDPNMAGGVRAARPEDTYYADYTAKPSDPYYGGNARNVSDPYYGGGAPNFSDPYYGGSAQNASDPYYGGNARNASDPYYGGSARNASDPYYGGGAPNFSDPYYGDGRQNPSDSYYADRQSQSANAYYSDRTQAQPSSGKDRAPGPLASTIAAASAINPPSTRDASTIESGNSRRRKKKIKKRKTLLGVLIRILIVLIVLIAAGIGGLVYLRASGQQSMTHEAEDVDLTMAEENTPDDVEEIEDDGKTITYKGEKYRWNDNISTILFLGSDRTLEQQAERESVIGINGQADTILLGIIDNTNKKISFINVNRDTMTNVSQYMPDGDYAGDKQMQICLAYSYGKDNEESCEMMASTVSNLLYGIPIDSYARISYDAVPMLNDSVGGVTVTLLEDMTGIDPSFVKGATVTLDGTQALSYIRSRDHSVVTTNELRIARQKQYFYAFLRRTIEATRADLTLPIGLYNNAKPYMTTSITPSQVTYLTSKVLEYGVSDDSIHSVPGSSVDGANGLVEFHTDETSLYELILGTFYNKVEK